MKAKLPQSPPAPAERLTCVTPPVCTAPLYFREFSRTVFLYLLYPFTLPRYPHIHVHKKSRMLLLCRFFAKSEPRVKLKFEAQLCHLLAE